MRIPRRRITPPPFIWKWPPSIGVKSHLFIELIHSFNFFSAPINHKCPFIRTVIQGLSEIHIPDLKRRLTWKTAAQKHACFRLSDNHLMPLCEYLFIRKKTLLGIQHFVFLWRMWEHVSTWTSPCWKKNLQVWKCSSKWLSLFSPPSLTRSLSSLRNVWSIFTSVFCRTRSFADF